MENDKLSCGITWQQCHESQIFAVSEELSSSEVCKLKGHYIETLHCLVPGSYGSKLNYFSS